MRFCVDYHISIEVSRFDAYPLPWVDKFLDWLLTDIGFNQGCGARVTDSGWAHHKPKEVCSWTLGGTVSGVPLGLWTDAAAGRKKHSDYSLFTTKDQKGEQAVFGAGRL